MLSDLAVDPEQGHPSCSSNPTSEMIDGLHRRILTGRRRLGPARLAAPVGILALVVKQPVRKTEKNVADLV